MGVVNGRHVSQDRVEWREQLRTCLSFLESIVTDEEEEEEEEDDDDDDEEEE